ncbi:nucleoside hydrolase [Tunicatimonas pelagia]|uniref:nucleoside hydrolase n=1 Tax=Tunicatimonas pelagia TaxID=931531 RepID=UPI0026669466|nr:nucleoside hydrolase [Tunicatimonas pelagia]WKN40614.1 nucleoside hydrolase [Tunicatimonas pelagia]
MKYRLRSKNTFFWVVLFCLTYFNCLTAIGQSPTRIVLDADTGNEVDDLYAIARALVEPSWNIVALNATHWQTSHWAEPNTMENSHRLNQLLLGYFDVSVPTRRGGVARMYDWGDLAQHSAAAYEIIKQAKATPTGEKLTVVALGALTNVASAIYIDPSIEPRIKLYWLGSSYDFENNILKRVDFNAMMDAQALEILLTSEIDMNVIPVNVASAMKFTFAEVEEKLSGTHQLGSFLVDRWYQHLDGSRKERTIWDLALIEAIIHPEWAETVEVTTSRDSGNRKINYYRSIDAEQMKKNFYTTLLGYFEQ